MKYLVTGGAGFIGSHLVDSLLEQQNTVVVVDNFFNGKEDNLTKHKNNPNLIVYKQSITEDLTDVFDSDNIDAVFHLAALPRVQFSIQYPIEAHNVNINGTINLLQSCRNFGVKKFIFSSSSSIYGNQTKLPLVETMVPDVLYPYAIQKLTGEHYCRVYWQLYGIETIMLRYFSVYGPRQNPNSNYGQVVPNIINAVINGKTFTKYGSGQHTRDFTFVSDVVAANVLAVNCNKKKCFGEVFNIGAGRGVSINDLIKNIGSVSAKKLKIDYQPALVESKDTLADNTKAQKLLGWRPSVSFEDGIIEEYKYFLEKN